MQTVGIASAEHHTSGKAVNDDDLTVLVDVIDVLHHDAVRLNRLIYVMGQGGILGIGEVFDVEELLRLLYACLGKNRGLCLFIDNIVGIKCVG